MSKFRYFTMWGWMVIALGLFMIGVLVGCAISDYMMMIRGLM